MQRDRDSRPVVLIVEDEPFTAMDLADCFEEAGFDVNGPHATAGAALAAIGARRPDRAVLDLSLLDGSSLPVARALTRAGVPFAVLSGHARDRRFHADLPDVPWIAKPAAPAQVIEALTECDVRSAAA